MKELLLIITTNNPMIPFIWKLIVLLPLSAFLFFVIADYLNQ